MNSQLNVGIIGLGGFAVAHHKAVYELERKKKVKLLCTCDIAVEKFAHIIKELEIHQRDVVLFHNYIEMLDRFSSKLNFVTIPTPIHLHAEMHNQAVTRKLPVYLEKPPTLDYSELQEMLTREKNAIKQTTVGFNFIVQRLRQKIKQRLISGEFGGIKKITFIGHWPRYASYFKRSPWAGKLILDNKFVLDSCFGNAISHYIHNILFWCGTTDIFSWDPVEEVRAELYRAHNIQGMDTIFTLASTEHVKDIRIALTHACSEKTKDIEKIYCDNAEIQFEGNAQGEKGFYAQCKIQWNNGKQEVLEEPYDNLLQDNIEYYVDYLLGNHQRPLTLLSDTEPFVMFNGLVYVAAKKIVQIPEEFVECINVDNNEYLLAIKDIKKISEVFIETGKFPSEQKIQWAYPGGDAKTSQIKNLHEVILNMAS
ncbi:MAG TPA: Gfo/Idh/MocA family oxidoreductase [bacterium]|nr:Gfo/Idh/MocA family oxidoreductase [bacterium]HOL35316.1 Gfo/Idh/MocA family oxidoreductase [bacterium]HPP09238.1 Gfo/Idh/MocA family oxidoreductase [bacterium]